MELSGASDPELHSLMNAIEPSLNQWGDNYASWYIIGSGVHLGAIQIIEFCCTNHEPQHCGLSISEMQELTLKNSCTFK